MFGYIFGAACLVGFIALARRRRYHYFRAYGYGGGCGPGASQGCGPGTDEGPYGGPWSYRRGWGPRAMLRGLFVRLDTTPAQEKVVLDAVDEVRQAGRLFRDELRKSRTEVADAFRGAVLDQPAVEGVFSRQDGALASLRTAVLAALGRVHDVLDERQRARLADLVARGPRWA